MNATQALTRLRKLLGKDAALRDNKRPSSPELRAAARAAYLTAKAHKDACEAARVARMNAILEADADYQRLKSEREAAVAALNKLSMGNYYRYTGGRLGSMFFSVAAEGDTLAELVDKVEQERAGKAA